MASHMQSGGKVKGTLSRGRVAGIVAGIVAALLAAAYLGGVAVFNFVYMPGTLLDGEDVSLRQVTDVASEKSASLDSFETHVSGDGLDLTVRGSQIDLACDGDSYAADALAQINPWAWPYEITQTRQISAEATTSFSREKLAALVEPVVEEGRQAAEQTGGTGISYSAEEGIYVLDEAAVAQHLDVDAVVDRLAQAFDEGEPEVVIGDECLDVGDGLTAALETANSYVSATLTLTLAGEEAYVVGADKISGWMTVNEDLSVTIDSAAVEEWGRGELSDLLDTAGTERTYTRPDGKKVTVNDGSAAYGASTYGWIIDGAETAAQVVTAIQAGEPTTLEIPTYQTAAQVPDEGGVDWGDRWIDVDISEQHARLYDGGSVLWEADITTGNPNQGNDTPSGVWFIRAKQDGDINLRGPENEDGELEWDSHVQFWMPFVRNLVGFHNAPWQSVYGGEIYLWNGSHGCIRMSYADAQALFNAVQVGDPVVIHY